MKKALMTGVLLLAIFAVQAQNKKGNWLAGVSIGSGGYTSSENEYSYSNSPILYTGDSKYFSIGISPEFGYYFTDRLVVGASIGLSYNNSESNSANSATVVTSSSESNSFYFSAGPFARLYVGKMNNKGMPYVQLNTGLAFYPSDNGEAYNSTDTYHYTYKTKNYFTWNAGPRIGYEHFFNESVGLHYYIGYSYSKSKYRYDYDFTQGGTDYSYDYETDSHNVNFGVGLQIHLDCSKKRK
jgi:hypothetical protein